MDQDNQFKKEELQVDEYVIAQLSEAGKWGRFIGVSGIIFSLLFIMAGIFFSAVVSGGASAPALPKNIQPSFISATYITGGIIGLIISFFLFRFGSQMKTALNFKRQDYLIHAFRNLKLVYRTMGVIVVVYLLIFIFASLFMGPSFR